MDPHTMEAGEASANDDARPRERAEERTPSGWQPGAVERRFAAAPSAASRTYDPEARTIEAVLATGYRVRRWYGHEELAIREDAIDLARVGKGQVRLLDHHNAYSRDAVLGTVIEARVQNGQLLGTIRFADNDAGRAAERDASSGDLTGISVGYRVQRLVLAEMGDDDVEVYRAERWELLEVSLVSVPADPDASVRSAVPPAPAITTSAGEAGGHEEETAMGQRTIENAPAPQPATGDNQRAAQPAPEPSVEDVRREAREAERARVAEIIAIGRMATMADDVVQRAIDEDEAVEAFRKRAMEKMAKDAADRAAGRDRVPDISAVHGGVEFPRGGQDERTTRRSAMIDAILHRDDPRSALSGAAREYRGLSLLDMARECLEAAGEYHRGMSKSEVAKRAFHSTSDFPFILENVANKSLRAAYEAYPRTFTAFARQIRAPDFREMKRVQLGEAPLLDKVNESGEFTRGSIAEGRESIKVDTYGKVVGVTRQVIINDDLGALTRVPGVFGTAIAMKESDLVWALITGNVVMSDGTALFHANHKNLIGSGIALGIEGLGKTRELMRRQVGLDGKTKINVRPAYLLVPTALETKAEQLINSTLTPDQAANAVPTSMRSLQIVVEPRLDDNSATAYYLAADPAVIDTIEYAYLEGQEGAYIETRMGFDVDGMEVKCRLDFGAAAIDWRGLAKNPGAAPN